MQQKEKFKVTRSALISAGAYIAVTIATIVFSICQVGCDLTRIYSSEFVGKLCINYCLAIIILFVSIRDGELRGKELPEFLDAYKALNVAICYIKEKLLISVFKYYTVDKFNKLRDEYIENRLCKHGLALADYKQPIDCIKEMKKSFKITKEQFEELMLLKEGKYQFTTYTGEEILSDYDDSASYQRLSVNRKGILFRTVGPKLILIFGTSALFASMIFGGGGSFEQVLGDLVSRILNIITALFCGFVAGNALASEQKRVYKEKTLFINEFITAFTTGEYIPELMDQKVINTILDFNKIEPKPKEEESVINREEVIEDEIELTQEELSLIKENRKSKVVG